MIETQTSYKFDLASNSNEYTINGLQPGSSLIVSLNGFLNGSIQATSNNLIVNTSKFRKPYIQKKI